VSIRFFGRLTYRPRFLVNASATRSARFWPKLAGCVFRTGTRTATPGPFRCRENVFFNNSNDNNRATTDRKNTRLFRYTTKSGQKTRAVLRNASTDYDNCRGYCKRIRFGMFRPAVIFRGNFSFIRRRWAMRARPRAPTKRRYYILKLDFFTLFPSPRIRIVHTTVVRPYNPRRETIESEFPRTLRLNVTNRARDDGELFSRY